MTVAVNVGLDCLAGASLSLTKESLAVMSRVCFQMNVNIRSSFKLLQPQCHYPLLVYYFLMQTFSLVVLF